MTTIISTHITWCGQTFHVEVTQPFGAGAPSYHIYINRYFAGSIVIQAGELVPFMNPQNVLSSDDLGAIMDIIKGNL